MFTLKFTPESFFWRSPRTKNSAGSKQACQGIDGHTLQRLENLGKSTRVGTFYVFQGAMAALAGPKPGKGVPRPWLGLSLQGLKFGRQSQLMSSHAGNRDLGAGKPVFHPNEAQSDTCIFCGWSCHRSATPVHRVEGNYQYTKKGVMPNAMPFCQENFAEVFRCPTCQSGGVWFFNYDRISHGYRTSSTRSVLVVRFCVKFAQRPLKVHEPDPSSLQ